MVADLGTVAGPRRAIDAVSERAGGAIDGLVTWAGVAGLTGDAGSLLVSVNYFGSVALLEGLRPLLANGDRPRRSPSARTRRPANRASRWTWSRVPRG